MQLRYWPLFLLITAILCTNCQDRAVTSSTEPSTVLSKETVTVQSLQHLPAIPPTAGDAMGARNDRAWAAFLVHPGDLPAGQKAGENIISNDKRLARNFPGLQFMVMQWLDLVEQDGEIGGTISLYIYDTADSAQRGYEKISAGLDQAQVITDIGETSSWSYVQQSNGTHIVFRRCRAVVEVSGIWQIIPRQPRGFFRQEDILKYARTLDQRLQKGVC